MKRLLFFLMTLGLAACLSDIQPDNDTHGLVSVKVRTVSLLPEDNIEDMNVFVYHDGVLYYAEYLTSKDFKMELNGGMDYTVYALANVGRVDPPLMQADLSSLKCGFPEPEHLPMCCRNGIEVNFIGDGEIKLEMTRLVSKISLKINNRLTESDLDIQAVQLMQTPREIFPFVTDSRATEVFDGQSADVEQLEKLKNGETISLYMLENCQGVLLPNNTNAGDKKPSKIGNQAEVCSYLNIKGKWTTNGAKGDSDVRLYLGENNCSDFNVRGNTNITITLDLLDYGLVNSGWRAELSNVEDLRSIQFVSDVNYVFSRTEWTEIPMRINPPDMTIYATLYEDNIRPSTCMEHEIRDGKVYVRGTYSGYDPKEASLTVFSWDYKQVVSSEVKLVTKTVDFADYEADIPVHAGEWGYILFKPQSDVPIRFKVGSENLGWYLGRNPASTAVMTYVNEEKGYELFAFPDSDIVYIHRTGVSSSGDYMEIRQGNGLKMLTIPPSVYPGVCGDSGFFTEAGCLQRAEDGEYYDSDVYVNLTDSKGNILDTRRFRTPDAVLTYDCLPLRPEFAYAEFDRIYPGIKMTAFASPYSSLSIVDSDQYEAYDKGYLRHCRLFGNGKVPVDVSEVHEGSIYWSNLSGSIEIRYRPAFPAQRDLGNIYNYSIAPGDMCSMTTVIDFTEGGKYLEPVKNLVTWKLSHATDSYSIWDKELFYRHADSTSKYVQRVSMADNVLTFNTINAAAYPSCGSMIARASVVNPHSKVKIEAFYRFDLVLYLAIGCCVSYAYPKALTGFSPVIVSVVPFYETNLEIMWKQALPANILTTSPDMDYFEGTENEFTLFKKYRTKISYSIFDALPKFLAYFAGYKSLFTFTINDSLNKHTGLNEYVFDRDGFGNYTYAYGLKGYYHVVCQYYAGNISGPLDHYGMDNYLIEAAFDNLAL